MSKESLFLHTTQLPNAIADRIEKLALESPWYYAPDCALDYKIVQERGLPSNPYFSFGMISNQGQIARPHFDNYPWSYFDSMVNPEKYGFNSNNKIRAHITLHWPRPDHYRVPHNKHVDQQYNHLVALYYINDSDGDTIFFDGDDIIHREPVKRGKLVVFNGHNKFHSSSSPSKNIRMTLNVNYHVEGF
jgi:hypothetical protein